jgi:hypothetical protein
MKKYVASAAAIIAAGVALIIIPSSASAVWVCNASSNRCAPFPGKRMSDCNFSLGGSFCMPDGDLIPTASSANRSRYVVVKGVRMQVVAPTPVMTRMMNKN